ncbi:phosphotransferase [Ornithinibacillus sp. L9]|uniref:Phosphotransferase n=1 Tax=Ornithinibacillus caprae TaxID=2678566 RepID=A0A6N8FEZ6_9BACI|nr:phosphotransferase family protein [Ornithinibacillus caprae]MUK86794.1 phosphotransferase [Ornithinibacillus caprae]
MVEWFKKVLGKEWNVMPAGGLTGDAYVAEKDDRRLFLKRNSSPFLAVLSAEGIVPKLVWTKRMENGDVITAQEWLEGRELWPEEMQHSRVADLLHKIHHSSELLHMLLRLGKKPITSDGHYTEIKERLLADHLIEQHEEVQKALAYLQELLPVTREQKQVVCHGDLNHHNMLLTNDGQLYLIDWDNAMIADPITDYGMILQWYIPTDKWDEWLEKYGVKKDEKLLKRMYWYLILDSLQFLAWHHERNEQHKVKERLTNLKELNYNISTLI